jgi:hypothetical protein
MWASARVAPSPRDAELIAVRAIVIAQQAEILLLQHQLITRAASNQPPSLWDRYISGLGKSLKSMFTFKRRSVYPTGYVL